MASTHVGVSTQACDNNHVSNSFLTASNTPDSVHTDV